MLLTVIAWSSRRGPNDGMVWGMLGGLFLDLASGAPLGISSLPLMVSAMVVGVSRTRIFSGNVILPLMVWFMALALYQILYVSLLAVSGRPVSWAQGIVGVAAPMIVLSLVLLPFVYVATSGLARLVEGSRVKLGR